MAKRGTLDNPKTLKLARLLKVEPWAALGLLEALWHWVGKYRPTGAFDRADIKDFGAGIRAKDPEKLLHSLVVTHWVDEEAGRYFIHHWNHHADDAVKKTLMRQHLEFDPYYFRRDKIATESRQDRDSVATVSRLPIPSYPCLSYPEPEPGPQSDSVATASDRDWDQLVMEYPGEIKPDWDCRFWIAVDDRETFWRNFALWKQTRRWQEGFAPSLENFLRKGQWKNPPPAERERKSARERMLDSMRNDA